MANSKSLESICSANPTSTIFLGVPYSFVPYFGDKFFYSKMFRKAMQKCTNNFERVVLVAGGATFYFAKYMAIYSWINKLTS